MLILHLLAGLVLGFVAALWGWCEGYTVWGMLGLYALGGNAGLMGSALVAFMRAGLPAQSKPSDLPQSA